MKEMCFYIEKNTTNAGIVNNIAECFPCWISWDFNNELTIKAREEDWPYIEKRLAPIV